jgi:hypothetical protein
VLRQGEKPDRYPRREHGHGPGRDTHGRRRMLRPSVGEGARTAGAPARPNRFSPSPAMPKKRYGCQGKFYSRVGFGSAGRARKDGRPDVWRTGGRPFGRVPWPPPGRPAAEEAGRPRAVHRGSAGGLLRCRLGAAGVADRGVRALGHGIRRADGAEARAGLRSLSHDDVAPRLRPHRTMRPAACTTQRGFVRRGNGDARASSRSEKTDESMSYTKRLSLSR